MPTLILSPRFTSDAQLLWKAAVSEGWNVCRARKYEAPEVYGICCCYGEQMFCDAMAEQLDLALLDPPDAWLIYLPSDQLKREVQFGKVEDLHKVKNRRFIKPANDKLFPARVYESGAAVPIEGVNPACPVLVSEVVTFETEIRFHVIDGRIVATAVHRRGVDSDVKAVEAKAWFEEVLRRPQRLPSAVVVDVGFIPDRGWAIVEANQAYSTGVYEGIDTHAVLQAILRSAGPRSAVQSQDLKYVRPCLC